MQDINNASYELDYYRRQQFKPGWSSLIEVIFSGILASADDADSRDFLRLMGSQLAEKTRLPDAQTVGELEDGINAVLSHFDWGWVQVEASEQEIVLKHHAYPQTPDPDNEPMWNLSFATVLEGVYATWLQAQGGAPHVSLRWNPQLAQQALVFSYKNGQ
ncbi:MULTISPECIES: cellulose biosynthesis protein BcsD [unclassified Serratia (in: enterobacteria)]|uniref:cellulose biosynthesis protein BcsD n=1 Tax=unclassified Serratia (in: enterobacteria) TaxID=2647522 RepID=UPI0005073A9E|nr:MULTISPECIES: cellulose biosynthesis protein BcsD [unclassified Serratia (in: enterobacteria)]KFK95607.1 cellulose synthase [Serratia sp. Ag2]KFL00379.1 cellulose synthase [Serratia sp. Ag1]